MKRFKNHPYPLYPLCLVCLMVSSSVIHADTLYLRDGSVLKGSVSDGVTNDVILSNPYFGDVSVLLADVLYQTTDQANTLIESYVITENLDVLAVLCRTVPARKEASDTFHMLIPGAVQSVTDGNGVDVPFDTRSLGANSLITIDYDALCPDSPALTVTTLLPGKIRPTDTGHMALQLRYIPDKDTSLQVLVKYPRRLKPYMITPESYTENDGLVIWERQLRRQQQFIPEIEFTL